MPYCGENCIVKTQAHVRTARKLTCRAWTCPDCYPDRKRGLIKQAHSGNPNTFITLTLRRGVEATPEQAALTLSRAWRLVRLRALREAKRDIDKNPTPAGFPPKDGWKRDNKGRVPRQVRLCQDGLPFLAVVEAHESGWPHLHILCRSEWIAKEWLSGQMNELHASHAQKIERIYERSRVGAYVAKYCGKAAHKFGTAKRYWASRDYDQRPDEAGKPRPSPGEGWEVQHFTLSHFETIWRAFGYVVERLDAKTSIARPPPDG